MIKIWRGTRGSTSSLDLARACGGRRNRNTRLTNMQGRDGDVLVNWGCRNLPPIAAGCTVLNQPEAVAIAVNKLRFYETLQNKGSGDIIPKFWTEPDGPGDYLLENEDAKVMARYQLTGSQGRGIELFDHQDRIGPPSRWAVAHRAPLYTEYVKKTAEYRVHVGKTGPHRYECFDVIMKRKRRGFDNANYQVRNERNGWVFCRENLGELPESVLSAARHAVASCGLHFGAVDVGYHGPSDRTVVYEVNTAPGLEGTTLVRYSDFIRRQAS